MAILVFVDNKKNLKTLPIIIQSVITICLEIIKVNLASPAGFNILKNFYEEKSTFH